MKTTKLEAKKTTNIDRLTAWVLTITGAGGVFASLMLSIEEFLHLKNPSQQLACDLNPLIGCGNILDTWQGHVLLGIPNQFLGLAAFSALTTLGVLLLARIKFPRWIWQGLQAGMVGGVIFVLWFMFESLFVLKHLCPYCMLTWTVTLAAAWYTTVYNIHSGIITLPKKLKQAGEFVVRHHADILISVYVLIIAGILLRFWDFFGQNL
jgi:uncharacterized membrane protein